MSKLNVLEREVQMLDSNRIEFEAVNNIHQMSLLAGDDRMKLPGGNT